MPVLARTYKGYDRGKYPEWANAIGRAMLNFSAIELLAYLWIEELCGEAEVKRYLKKWHPIGMRIDEITGTIAKKHPADQWGKQAVETWTHVKDHTAKIRNDLAHNPTVTVNRGGLETIELLFVGTYDESTGKLGTANDPKAIAKMAEEFGDLAAELHDMLAKRP